MGATYKIVIDVDYERGDEEPINVTIEPQRSHCFRYRRLHNNQTVKEALYMLTLTVSTLIRKYHLALFCCLLYSLSDNDNSFFFYITTVLSFCICETYDKQTIAIRWIRDHCSQHYAITHRWVIILIIILLTAYTKKKETEKVIYGTSASSWHMRLISDCEKKRNIIKNVKIIFKLISIRRDVYSSHVR